MDIYIDGSGFNGRKSRFAIVRDGQTSVHEFEEELTNNEMEYRALAYALDHMAAPGDTVLTDSQLIVGQVTKGWKVNAKHLQGWNQYTKDLMEELEITLKWVPRSENLAGKVLEK